MSKKIKMITALLAVMFCATAFSITAYAVDGDEDTPVTPQESSEAEPSYEPDTPSYEPDTPSYEPDTPSYEPDTPSYQPDYSSSYYSYNDNNSSYYNDNSSYQSSSNNNYYEYNDVNSYLGDGQTYVEPSTAASAAAVYDVDDRKIDDTELSSNDWKEIQANLNKANSSGSDSDDFAFIKNNDSKIDNGDWMLILGIILLVLSGAGFAYVVVSHIMRRKRVKSGASGGYAGRTAERFDSSQRSNNDYSDGYKSSAKNQEKMKKRRSKFDTAEVRVPTSSNGSRYRNSNGKRYK